MARVFSPSGRGARRGLLAHCVCAAWFLVAASCGGGAGGAGPGGAGQGLVLTSFLQADLDNVPLNTELEFSFSEAVSAGTISPASIQIREGDAFGRTVDGAFQVSGSVVRFRPRLPGLCDRSDAGFKPHTNYRVMLVGHPEEFSIRNSHGQPLSRTSTYQFSTLPDSDPDLFLDRAPGTGPSVIDASPASTDSPVTVAPGNKIELTLSENLDACSLDSLTVVVQQVEVGEKLSYTIAPNGNATGFDSITDASPDPRSWGSTNSTPVIPAQRIPSKVELVQGFDSTRIIITPVFGRFPENSLIVVELSSGIKDFSGQLLTPYLLAFTTENTPPQAGSFDLHYDGEVPMDDEETTADVDTPRSNSKAQGYLLFAGDGDNGPNPNLPTLPESNPPACTVPFQSNDGTKDDFDPVGDTLLDTGSSGNQCPNSTDGSKAVVWEFNSFRIRGGVTVRVVGKNPAIFLVVGDVLIETGGTLVARGDNIGGSPQGRGINGVSSATSGTRAGGRGVAGGGGGGNAFAPASSTQNGGNGFSGFGSPDYDPTEAQAGPGYGGVGAGKGGTPDANSDTFGSGASQGGGGGGHAKAGVDGVANPGQNLYGSAHTFIGAIKGKGGVVYPSTPTAEKMRTPSAGSGGGAAGDSRNNGGTYDAYGGSGGAGGGFVDLTSSGDVFIFGTIDAAGSSGGSGYYDQSFTASGGGGGGSGGGIRVLSPLDINVTNAVLTTAGGAGGTASSPTNGPNHGGAGGNGRVVLEDGDSVISGLGTASITPAEGNPGFYRGMFDASRFVGGGLSPSAVTQVFLAGPFDPEFTVPVAGDFIAGVPGVGSRGAGLTSILVEVRGYPLKPDGTPDLGVPSPWYTVGYFTDSGVVANPTWHPGAQPPVADVTPPAGNAGVGIASINHLPMIQVRATFYLPSSIGPFDGGPYIDRWVIRYTFDQ